MYFSVSPQAYLDSLEGNTNTNTILETVPHGSLTFTFSMNKENLAFWRNALIVSTNNKWLGSHWQTKLSGSCVGTAVPQFYQFPWAGMGWAAWEGFAASFQRTGFPLVLLISCHLVTFALAFGEHRTFIPPVSQCPLHSACLLRCFDHSSFKYLCAEFLRPASQYIAAHAGGTTVDANLKLFKSVILCCKDGFLCCATSWSCQILESTELFSGLPGG